MSKKNRDEDRPQKDLIRELEELRQKVANFKAEKTQNKQTKAHLQLATTSACIALWDWNIAKDYTVWSDNSEELLGFPYKSFGNSYQEYMKCVYPDDINAINDRVANALKKKQKEYRSEYRVILPDGEIRWISAPGKIFYDSTDKPIRIAGIMIDITENKKKVVELKNSLKTSVDIINNVPYGLFIYQYEKPDRLILLSGNSTAERFTGIIINEWIGKEINKIWPEARKLGLTDAYLKVIETGKSYETEDIYYKDKKLEGAFRIKAFLLPGEKLCMSFDNITERKQAEEKLKSSLSKLDASLESTADGILIVSRERKITKWNQKFAKMWKLSAKMLENDDDAEVINLILSQLSDPDLFITKVNYLYNHPEESSFDIFGFSDNRFFERYSQPQKVGDDIVGRVWSFRDITERKLAEEVLRQYEHIVSSSTDMLALLDNRYNYLSANKAYLDEFNFTPDQLIGKTVESVFGDEFFNSVIKPNGDRCLNGNIINYQDWFDFPTTGNKYMDITYYPYYGVDNMVKGFVVCGRNITKRKQAEEKLYIAETKFKRIFDISPGLICVTNVNFNYFTECNPAVTSILGFSVEEFTSNPFMEFIHPEDRQGTENIITEHQNGMIVSNFENRYRCKNGSYKWLSWEATDADKNGRIYSFATDINIRKQSEMALKNSEERFRMIFEGGPLGMCTIDFDYQFINVNKNLCTMLGYSKAELSELSFSDVIINDKDLKETDFLQQVLNEKSSSYKSSKSLIKKNGETICSLFSVSMIHDTEKNPLYALCIIEDINEAMEAEIKLNNHIRHLSLTAEIGRILTHEKDLSIMLQLCCETVIVWLGSAFARIWTINEANDALELQASAGMYTHKDGNHCCITQTNSTKIWRSYEEKSHFLTNEVVGDPQVLDQDWAKKENMVAFAGHPLMVTDRVLGVFGMFSKKRIDQDDFEAMGLVSNQIALGILRKWSEDEQTNLHNQLHSLSSHLQKVQEKEKKNLARELHDELGQFLTAMNLEMFNVKEICSYSLKNDNFYKVEPVIEKISQLMETTMKVTEKIIMNLRPVILDDLGLLAALKWLVTQIDQQSNIECKFESTIGSLDLNQEQAIALYRIVQENITNILRHSKATKMSVLLKEENNQIHIIVSDNGKGFDKKEMDKSESFGILGMKERTYLFGWDLSFETKIGKGTTVSLIIPKGDLNDKNIDS